MAFPPWIGPFTTKLPDPTDTVPPDAACNEATRTVEFGERDKDAPGDNDMGPESETELVTVMDEPVGNETELVVTFCQETLWPLAITTSTGTSQEVMNEPLPVSIRLQEQF